MADIQAPGTANEHATGNMHSMLDSSFPVYVPYSKELTITDQEFATYVSTLKPAKVYQAPVSASRDQPSQQTKRKEPPSSRFIDALSQDSHVNEDEYTLAKQNKIFTENSDVAFASTGKALLDAFYELKESAADIEKLLNEAWAEDPEATLRIIFNARSIHLGKADKNGAYKALGWLYQYHPQTLLANLIWLARPVIEKKIKQESEDKSTGVGANEKEVESGVTGPRNDEEDDFEMVEGPGDNVASDLKSDSTTFVLSAADAPLGANTIINDVKYGVAHGYWKDLANILLLAVNDEFKANGDVDRVLKVDTRKKVKGRVREWDATKAKEARQTKQADRHHRFENKFEGNAEQTSTTVESRSKAKSTVNTGDESGKTRPDETFRALHITIARLFASQLLADATALTSGKGKRGISFAAKWCPSPAESHDKQTFLVTSIAEAMFSVEQVCPAGTTDRLTYLKHARLALRSKILSPLRKHLAIVERDITAGTFTKIKYDRLPSFAMNRYSGLFLSKDEERFSSYLERVTEGKARVSGAVLLPSTLVAKTRESIGNYREYTTWSQPSSKKTETKLQKLAERRLRDGQWKTLVKRIKESGKIESAIAVCDVSGSMGGPRFSDGTCPMDSAIGLALLLAEVVEPPFGGNFISFHARPTVHKVGGSEDERTFEEKVEYILKSPWGMNTNFEAVFADLILPLAVEHNLKPEEMVKTVFVFSDMQFDSAQAHNTRWNSSFERIKKRYAEAGYEMPELVFWNLAFGTRGAPVSADEQGVSLVSGYSQGMLKMFLEGGKFEEEVEEEVVEKDVDEEADEEAEGETGDAAVEIQVQKKVKKDPLATVKKAISHPAYAMLKVAD